MIKLLTVIGLSLIITGISISIINIKNTSISKLKKRNERYQIIYPVLLVIGALLLILRDYLIGDPLIGYVPLTSAYMLILLLNINRVRSRKKTQKEKETQSIVDMSGNKDNQQQKNEANNQIDEDEDA